MKQLQLLSVAVLSVCAASAFADVTTTFQVTADVNPTCVLDVPDLSFGTYDPVDSEPTDGSTVLTATCVDGAAYNIGLDAGLHATTPGDVSTRNMYGPTSGDLLPYDLFIDSSYLEEWGNTVGVNTVPDTGTGLPLTYTIYGQIPAGETSVGDDTNYNDTITVDVSF